MAYRPPNRRPSFEKAEGYTITDSKGKQIAHFADMLDAFPVLRTRPEKSELYRNSDGALLAYTTGSSLVSDQDD